MVLKVTGSIPVIRLCCHDKIVKKVIKALNEYLSIKIVMDVLKRNIVRNIAVHYVEICNYPSI